MWLSLIIDKTFYSFVRAENWANLLWGGATSILDGIFDLALLGQFWRVMVFFCKLQHSYKDEIWTFIVLFA